MGKSVLETLAVVLGVDADTKKLKEFEEGVNTVKSGLKAMIGVGVLATGGIFALSKASAEAADVIGKTASKMSLSTDNLQAYIYASEQAGGSQEKFISSFSNLESKMQEATMGSGSAIQAFKMMGISLTDSNGMMKDTTSVMNEVSDSFAQISDKGMKQNLAKQLGFDDSMITMLQDGSKSLNAVKNRAIELGGIKTPQMIKDSANFNDNLNDTSKVFGGISNMLTSKFIPLFSGLMRKFNDWYIANKKLIQQRLGVFIQNLIKFVSGFITIVKELLIWVDNMAQSFGGWEKVLKFVGIALGALALYKVGKGVTALFSVLKLGAGAFKLFGNEALMAQVKAMLIPIAIGALIVGLIALVDEFMAWKNGAKSILSPAFEWIAEKFNKFKELFPNVSAVIGVAFDGITGLFSNAFATLGNIWDLITGKLTISEFFTKQFDMLKSSFENIKTVFKDFMKTVLEPFEKAKDKLSNGVASVKSFFGFGGDKESSPISNVANSNTNIATQSSSSKTDISIPIIIHGNIDNSTIDNLEHTLKQTANSLSPMVH